MTKSSKPNNTDRLNTPEANKKKGPRYDWDAISQDYITSNMTLKDIAEKYGMRVRTVSDRSSADGWVEKRKAYKKTVSEKTLKKTAAKTATKRSNILQSVLESTDTSAGIIADRLQSPGEIDSAQLKEYLQSLKLIEEMARSIQGILTKSQERKLKIEEEKLELEKAKVDQREPDRDITITIGGYDDEWSR